MIVGLVGLAVYFVSNWDSVTPAAEASYVRNTPSEQPPPAADNYRVPPDHPRVITIGGEAKIRGLVEKVGVVGKNQMDAPSNVHMAGWFSGSALPGQPGLSIMDGHVNSNFGAAVFQNLGKVKPNDTIAIELGNGSHIKYSVTATKQLNLSSATEQLFADPKDRELRLITCAGKWQSSSQTYDQRLIVYAKKE